MFANVRPVGGYSRASRARPEAAGTARATIIEHVDISNTSWMLDELAHAGPEHLDDTFIAGYDHKQGHPDPEPDLAVFRSHGLDHASTLVDLGAGTGQLAIPAGHEFGRVVAVDVSPAMLAVIDNRARDAGLTNVERVQAGFLSYEHAGEPVDAVFTRNALHHLPDFWKALALQRIAGMLRPGGVLRLHDLIYDCQPAQVPALFDRWLASAVSDPAEGYTQEDYVEHIRTEYSTFRWLLEPMLEAAGFEIESADFRGGIFGAYTCRRQ